MSDKTKEVAVQGDHSVEALARLIMTGRASEQEKGLVLRTIQVGMATNMVAGLNELHSTAAKAMQLYAALDEEYLRQVQEQLTSQLLTKEEIRIERDALEKRMHAILNLERQIVQGKNIFPEDSLSEDDRKILRLMASVKTPEERKKFFKAIDNYFQNSNSFDEPIKEKEPSVEASEEVE